MVTPPVLTDGALTLRVPGGPDALRIAELCQDPDVQAWTTVPTPYRLEHAEGFLESVATGWDEGENRVWGIVEDGLLHGMIGLHRVRNGSCEVGFWLGPDARGRGLLTRALNLVLDHAFDPAGGGCEVVEWRAFAGNWPSWRAAWRVGFRFDGVARLGVAHGERRVDDWMGSLLRGEPRTPRAPWPGLEDVRPAPLDLPEPWPAVPAGPTHPAPDGE